MPATFRIDKSTKTAGPQGNRLMIIADSEKKFLIDDYKKEMRYWIAMLAESSIDVCTSQLHQFGSISVDLFV